METSNKIKQKGQILTLGIITVVLFLAGTASFALGLSHTAPPGTAGIICPICFVAAIITGIITSTRLGRYKTGKSSSLISSGLSSLFPLLFLFTVVAILGTVISIILDLGHLPVSNNFLIQNNTDQTLNIFIEPDPQNNDIADRELTGAGSVNPGETLKKTSFGVFDNWLIEADNKQGQIVYTATFSKDELNKLVWTVTVPGRGFWSVWASSPSDLFAVGDSGILHFDGQVWSLKGCISNSLWGIWGSSSSDILTVGSGGIILHYDGNAWSTMASGVQNDLRGVWGTSPSDVFAVGHNGIILHYDGNSWSTMIGSNSWDLNGIWGSSPYDVFAVGSTGVILHYNGNYWTTMDSGTGNSLFGIWGSSSSNVFAVGFNGTILHCDGSVWSTMADDNLNDLDEVWGSSPSAVYAVGFNGTIMRYNGYTWVSMTSGNSDWLRGIWGNSPSDIFIVGNSDILRYQDGTWSPAS